MKPEGDLKKVLIHQTKGFFPARLVAACVVNDHLITDLGMILGF